MASDVFIGTATASANDDAHHAPTEAHEVTEATETLELTALPELAAQAKEIQLSDDDLALFAADHG